MTFGVRLRQARLEAGLSQAELGGDEFTVSYVSHLEAGRREPSARVTATFERRLGLPRGYLSGEAWGTGRQGETRTTLSTADVAAFAAGVERMRTVAPPSRVAVRAQEAADIALRHDRPEVWWWMGVTAVRSLIAAGDFDAALQLSTALSEHPWVQSQQALVTEAHTLACVTARRAVDMTAATHHAHAALDSSHDLGDAGLRAEAVIAALATRAFPVEGLVAELETLHRRLEGSHLGGRVAWTIGNEAFNLGEVEEGLAWHDRAREELNPDVDHRSWARFFAASALQRVRHRVDDGVADLIELSRRHLARLGSTEELADLARTEAQWHLQSGRVDEAVRVLGEAFDLAELPDRARARLHLSRGQALLDTGATGPAAEDALAAARLLTITGDTAAARDAWQVYDVASRGGAAGVSGHPAHTRGQ